MRRPILCCVLAIVAPSALAQVYECTDARGVKQYAGFCPPGTVQQRQVGKAGESSAADGAKPPGAGVAPKSIEAQEMEFKKRLLERQEAETKAEQDKAQAEESERNCRESRAQLQAVQDGQRMSRFDPVTGERVQFGDEELADEAERQRKAIAQWCK